MSLWARPLWAAPLPGRDPGLRKWRKEMSSGICHHPPLPDWGCDVAGVSSPCHLNCPKMNFTLGLGARIRPFSLKSFFSEYFSKATGKEAKTVPTAYSKSQPSGFMNETLLTHSHLLCLQIISRCFYNPKAELSTWRPCSP